MTRHRDRSQVCRLEVVETGRRRRWSFEEKLRIVEESRQGHRQVSATARRHGISSSLLFAWRRDFREGRLADADVPSLLPAVVLADDQPASRPSCSGRMEIVIGEDRRVIVGADVDATALALVLEILRRR
ncbi:MAG: transposase [Sphingomonadales bacterium]|nr:transposase [Sphingomonadales bacterium]